MTRPHVQLLYLPDCPNYQPPRELIEQTGRELGIDLDLELIASAHRLRFIDSRTVRINGRDVEPDARGHTDVALSCRIDRTNEETRGYPDRELLRTAMHALGT